MANLDSAYEELKEAQTMTFMEFEKELLSNQELAGKYFRMMMDDPKVIRFAEGFISYAWKHYHDEHIPAHTNAWVKPGFIPEERDYLTDPQERPQEYDPGDSYQESLKRRFGGGE